MVNALNNIISDTDLCDGETRRMTCPICRAYGKTFTITNNVGRLVWNCYKASCDVSGSKRVILTSEDIMKSLRGEEKKRENVKFVLPDYVTKDVNESVKSFLSMYKLKELDVLYDVKEHRIVFPIIHNNKMVDVTGRSLGKRLPKWKRYGKSDLPYSFGYGKVAVVVEDCVSACVIGNDVYVGVAVLGTSLSESHKRYLAQFSTVVVALDPDALPKTLSFCKELRSYVREVRVLKLIDDLKYRNPTDIENLTTIGEKVCN